MAEINKENEQVEQEATAQAFFEKNKKLITNSLYAVVILVAIIMLGYNFWYAPTKTQVSNEAAELVTELNQALEQTDSTAISDALYGTDGDGLLALIEDNSMFVPEEAVFMAGVAAYESNDYEEALKQFQSYSSSDAIYEARAIACQGYCYAALGNDEEAKAAFAKAAETEDGFLAAGYLVNEAEICEKLGEAEKAVELYNKIIEDYPESYEAVFVAPKNIARIEAK